MKIAGVNAVYFEDIAEDHILAHVVFKKTAGPSIGAVKSTPLLFATSKVYILFLSFLEDPFSCEKTLMMSSLLFQDLTNKQLADARNKFEYYDKVSN